MKLDRMVLAPRLEEAGAVAVCCEKAGCHGLWTSESRHDPFMPLAIASQATTRLELGTAIAVAFPRSPMITAIAAWDLQRASCGRFVLGLGTQVAAHNLRRFGLTDDVTRPWARLRELVEALRHIWGAFQGEHRLGFVGDFYRLDLLTSVFDPGPIEWPLIPIYLAAVRSGAYRLAGEIADGVHIHPFHTPGYLREVALPALHAGLDRAGRQRGEVSLAAPVFCVVGAGPEQAAGEQFVRSQLGFNGATKAYAPVLEFHGWEGVGERLRGLASAKRFDQLANALSDEILDAFTVYGRNWPDTVNAVGARSRDLADRVSLSTYRELSDTELGAAASRLSELTVADSAWWNSR